MSPLLAPAVLGLTALAVWGLVAVQVRRRPWLQAVQDAALVSILAACAGSSVSALGFVGMVSTGAAAVVGSAWRTAVIVAGVYALIALRRGAR